MIEKPDISEQRHDFTGSQIKQTRQQRIMYSGYGYSYQQPYFYNYQNDSSSSDDDNYDNR